MSLGSRSLVNCTRLKLRPSTCASAWARLVLPTPGRSSISRWPRASRQASAMRSWRSLPTTTVARVLMMRSVTSNAIPFGSAFFLLRALYLLKALFLLMAFASDPIESAAQVGLDVGDVLQAYRDPYQVFGDARGSLLVVVEPAVGGGGRVHDRRLGIAEVGGQRQDARTVEYLPGLVTTALDTKRQYTAEMTLLLAGQIVAGVVRQAGIKHALHRRVVVQPAGQCQRVVAVRLHAQPQGFEPFQEHPGIERAHAGATAADKPQDIVHLLGATHHHTTQTTALAVEVLGRGMHHNVRAQVERALQRRRAETVIHHQQRVLGMSQLCQGLDVRHFAQRVGRRLYEQQARPGGDGRAPGVEIAQVDKGGIDAELLHELVEQNSGGTEHTA